MTSQNTFPILLSVGVSIAVIGLICYCLWRASKSGVMILYSRLGGATKFRRDQDPVAYWFLFSCWLLLIPVILWMMLHRVENLLHGISA
jgi:hypothetical protein